MLTLQEILDKVVERFWNHPENFSYAVKDSYLTCKYRSDTGNKCVIGMFVEEEEDSLILQKNFGNHGVNKLYKDSLIIKRDHLSLYKAFQNLGLFEDQRSLCFLAQLQKCHDESVFILSKNRGEVRLRQFQMKLKSLAGIYELECPSPNAC